MNNNDKKNKIINIFILLSIFLFLIYVFLVIFSKTDNQLNLFYDKFNDLLADFFNVLMYISERNPYNNTINGLAEKAYLPISYLILYPFSKVGKYYNFSSLSQCYTNIGIFLSFIFTLVSIALLLFSCKKLCEKWNINKKVLIPIFISGIFMHTIERGNLIIISVSSLILFLAYYNSDNKYKRYFASFCLAFATCLKFYPVVFGLLYLKEKRYKDAILAAVFALILAFVPFLLFKGGFDNIGLLFRNMSLNSKAYNSINMFSGLSIRNLINYIFYGNLRLNEQFVINLGNISFYILAGLSIVTLILSLLMNNKFNIISSLFFTTIFLQSNSRFYCILYIIPVYLLMFKELNNRNYKKWIYLMLYFIILFMPIRILYNVLPVGAPINEYLSVLLTIIFFLINFIRVIKDFIKAHIGGKNEQYNSSTFSL